jgi:integrase
LGADDTRINRALAETIAIRIEQDIATQNFDSTLRKYKTPEERRELTSVELFERYYKIRSPRLATQTKQKYLALLRQLQSHYKGRSSELTTRQAQGFVEYLEHDCQQKLITIRDRLSILNACWDWGLDEKLIDFNPWDDVQKSLRKGSKPKPKPFTREEWHRIVTHFRTTPELAHYADLVEFRFLTGCRTGEAVGLLWKHIARDCSAIVICESVCKGDRTSTKTDEIREFTVSHRVKEILLERRQRALSKLEKPDPNALVFPGPKGKPIEAANFAKRQWKPALEKLGIEYRRPYKTRSTFVSHALDMGVTPAEISEITGHKQETLFGYYSGAVRQSKLPEFLDL